ncbi:transcriptional regulator [Echinicola strongylocentroti]|uniref:Transcriptional regulator n=1 Tax=Echinicola strongylocentroti TaxID=1795355 RepID=A0A2Z4IE73_9BACT|nr:DNA-binding transcriptional regulator [Echinicola strongylocentroti]AWW28778.1 transcriptional regulator [Echinicola strongylocentroti]
MYKVILLLDFAEEYSKSLLKGISKYSAENGPWTFCRMPLYYRETVGIKGILDWAKDWGADGIIGQFYNNMDLEMVIDSRIPIIAQDFKERFEVLPNITGNYHKMGALGADYFLKKGFKHFAFYGFNNIVWSRERAEGFENQVNKHGYKVHYFEHRKSPSTDIWHYKSKSLSNWLLKLPKPIALMTCDDNQALHITEACRQNNIRIPEEVAVLGVDNDVMLCELSDPPLSSIAMDIEKGGYEAAKLLEHMIIHDHEPSYDIIVEATQIITRQSTDIYATNDEYIASSLRYIHQHIENNLNVEDVVKQVPLSRRSLEKRFLQITGYPIYKYISNLRTEKFSQKLLETDMTVLEIAMDLGLNDSKNIARQFRQIKGCNPIEYRKKYLAGK